MKDQIRRAIEEGIFEEDGFRYVCDEMFTDTSIIRTVKRISLESLRAQYEDELKSADEISGWEIIANETTSI